MPRSRFEIAVDGIAYVAVDPGALGRPAADINAATLAQIRTRFQDRINTALATPSRPVANVGGRASATSGTLTTMLHDHRRRRGRKAPARPACASGAQPTATSPTPLMVVDQEGTSRTRAPQRVPPGAEHGKPASGRRLGNRRLAGNPGCAQRAGQPDDLDHDQRQSRSTSRSRLT